MHSLYWRIFLSFWLALALILVGTVTVAVNVTLQRRAERPWIQREQLYTQAEQAFRTGGPDALKTWLSSMHSDEPFPRTFVVDPSGRELLHRPLPGFLRSPHDSPSEPDRTTAPCRPQTHTDCAAAFGCAASMCRRHSHRDPSMSTGRPQNLRAGGWNIRTGFPGSRRASNAVTADGPPLPPRYRDTR